MLDSITIVIKMTGLLLLTPSSGNATEPVHVIMPRTAQHVARIAYPRARRARHCAPYMDGLCWVDMERFTMQIGHPDTTRPAFRLPSSVVNLSRRLHARVPPTYLGDRPGPGARSRITLNRGRVADVCGVAEWSLVKDVTSAALRDTVEIANVVTWEMKEADEGGGLILRRRRTDVLGDTALAFDTIPAVDGVVELYIAHVPQREADQLAATGTSDSDGITTPGTRPEHFHGFYDLLRVNPAHYEHLPILVRRTRLKCPWRETQAMLPTYGVGTLSCMIGGGDNGP